MKDLSVTEDCKTKTASVVYLTSKIGMSEYEKLQNIVNDPEFISCELCVHKFNYKLTGKCNERFSLNRQMSTDGI